MQAEQFLLELLPSEGKFALGVLLPPSEGDKKQKMHNRFHTTVDSLVADAQAEQAKGRDVYVTPATFKDGTSRTASNALLVKSFFLDLDVGPESHKYPSKKSAVLALTDFLARSELPAPSVVDSGGGVHVYWVLEEAITIAQWFPIAARLKKICKQFEFKIDSAVTADAARIMRLVGSKNMKRGGAPVVVKTWNGLTPLETFEEAVGKHIAAPSWLENAGQSWMKNSALAQVAKPNPDYVSYFKGIAVRSIKGTGCAQLAKAIIDQAGVSEPVWRAALSIAWHCEDADTAIHKISNKHPEYDYDATIAKAMRTEAGPYKCETFDDLTPGVCPQCIHWGKITSPIQLGSTLKATPATKEGAYKIEEPSAELAPPPQFVIPQYPAPYFRPASGGVALAMDTGEGAPENWLLTDMDVWPEKLIRDDHTKDMFIWMRTYHSKQGLNDFVIPNCVSQLSDLSKKLEQKGLIFSAKAAKPMQDYIFQSIRALNNKEAALVAPNKFGWDSTYTSFIIGDRRYKLSGGFDFAPPSTYTGPLVPFFTPQGDLPTWKKAMDYYCSSSNYTMFPLLTAVLAAPASLLMPWTGKNGVVVSIYGESGDGKTTAQKFGLSMFGDPQYLLLTTKDTPKSWTERMGTSGNMPIGLEEMTLATPETLRKVTYDITEGRSGNQANQYGGGEKISGRTWSLILTMSSNESIRTKLSAAAQGALPEANIARVMEVVSYKNTGITKEQGDFIEKTAHGHYGRAGEVIIPHLLKNSTRVAQQVAQRATAFAGAAKASRERYQIAGYAALLTAADVMNELGLAKIDVKAYEEYLRGAVLSASESLDACLQDQSTVFAEYLRTFMAHCAIVDVGAQGDPVVIDAERLRHPVKMRYERHHNKLYVPASDLREFCALKGFEYKALLQGLMADGALKTTKTQNKRLLAGYMSRGLSPTLRCLELEMDLDA